MSLDFFALTLFCWLLALSFAVLTHWETLVRLLLTLGILAALAGAALALPGGSGWGSLYTIGTTAIDVHLDPSAAWLLGWGLIPALFAVFAGGPTRHPRAWLGGVALCLIGALGVGTVQDGISLLIAWELMSFGAAVMLLADRQGPRAEAGQASLFMLGLLEVGAVALLLAVITLGGNGLTFATWPAAWTALPTAAAFGVGILFLIGFGAKLGLLPFYEWYPSAYSSGSGASGAILSGVVLNMAFFALGRALLSWMPAVSHLTAFGIVVVAVATLTAILTILYAFQQEDWRSLLAFSSAENAALAVTALGAAILFRAGGLPILSTLAWVVALIQLGGHSLAKGTLMLAADRVQEAKGDYRIVQSHLMALAPWTLGLATLFGAMSLAALPPQAGFVGEWYLFQTIFQDFHLASSAARVTLALAGAGLALTAAIALATMAKVFGVGLLGKNGAAQKPLGRTGRVAVLLPGLTVLLYAVGMPWWLSFLGQSGWPPHPQAVASMVRGWLLVPLTAKFAFISPTLLMIVGPLLALLPLGLLFWSSRRGVRRAPIWAHGTAAVPRESATTALVFSNALRNFYSFVYRPQTVTRRESVGREYFITHLHFTYSQAPVFGTWVFEPITRLAHKLADALGRIQSGSMNVYLAYIGILLVMIFAVTFLVR
jgi:formate hydrogenlyase subunit 3/multisubunit Na+/H+ antiporter MnhD subunit